MADLRAGLRALRPTVEGRPDAMASLARLFLAAGLREEAAEVASRAWDQAPQESAARSVAAMVLSAGVPDWHFAIVHDEARNEAYDRALRSAVFPGCTVLEIGTGTGLLAMMAARAGAGRVITCEQDPAIARAAREVVARNGWSHCVQVVARHSSALQVEDLGAPADVLVSEIISNDVVSGGVLPVVDDAVRRLVRPGGSVIPRGSRVRVALAEHEGVARRRMGKIAGFDLRPFDRLAAPRREIAAGSPQLALRSEARDLFTFDFTSGGPHPDSRARVTLSSHGGRIDGVVQWLALDLDETVVYENHPAPGARSCWALGFTPWAEPAQFPAGQKVTVHGHLEGQALRLWACPSPSVLPEDRPVL
ncbi:MAG: 50S ribosomal protein L11 methyltransferase [Vicinamibacteria bacterium]|nr:50S ribosomal protein L11 methyltransferase [Vicinamibacteria bacterium]